MAWRDAVGRLSHRVLILETVAFAAVGIGCGALLFPSEASLIGVVLLAFSNGRTVERLLDRNRDEIWAERRAPIRANLSLAAALFTVFVAVFATYVVAVQLAPRVHLEALFDRQLGDFAATATEDIVFGSFGDLLSHNAVVMLGCFLFALFYRHAGMLLVLAWNASAWGVVFSYVALTAAGEGAADRGLYLVRTLACILPHLALEAAAYVVIAMAGVFTSRGVARHALDSPELVQVGAAVLQIISAGALLLALAAAVEAWGAPALVTTLFE